METQILLGDEAVALAAVHAGIGGAYAYPGTPSTEILEYLVPRAAAGGFTAHWCVNEKTAYEQALGMSMLGARALVAMKHVGLNVAMDPFVNSALVALGGGLVVAVADDPGMHSSQNEQDTRILADFARVPCLEPADPQEAYDMTREAFDLSERFGVPVVLRLVTRLCHSRAAVAPRPPRAPNPVAKAPEPQDWILLPHNARRRWRGLLDRLPEMREAAARAACNVLVPGGRAAGFGVLTAGLARHYFSAEAAGLGFRPPWLHIGMYPAPEEAIRLLAAGATRLLVIEEGYPYLERQVRGVLPHGWEVRGKESGDLPLDGELTPDLVRSALGLPPRPQVEPSSLPLPGRPPQLCKGCPHADSFEAVREALAAFPQSVVTADIGCYTLGALPPYSAIESCVCMGASVGMAKGASDAGQRPALAVIGDSTFLHSGVAPLMDALAANTPMTLLILDNGTVAMTGLQPTRLPGSRLEPLLLGMGVDREHLHVVEVAPRRPGELAALLRDELAQAGVSVIVAVRDCVELAKAERRESEKA
ncbi:MAG: indolepyruvate ferredoxin oxidoreductase [Actinobacteria bacterium]|nr:indolepyruvate ferredoxin oxidoreductase [Actinomycetota bacterium]